MKRSLAAFGFVVVASNVLALNIVQNGSFEDGDKTGMNYSWKSVGIGNTGPDYWTPEANGFDWHNTSEFKPCYDGNYMVDLTYGLSYGGISQVLQTVVGTTYKLSFALGGPNTGFQDPRVVTVKIGSLTQQFSQKASSNLGILWGVQSCTFVAESTSTKLTFLGNDLNQYWGPVIDDVSVVEVGSNGVPIVPGPLAAIPFLAGLLALRRRSR